MVRRGKAAAHRGSCCFAKGETCNKPVEFLWCKRGKLQTGGILVVQRGKPAVYK